MEHSIAGADTTTRVHTPGPWRYCNSDTGGCICGQVWCADYPVAIVTIGKWGDDYPTLRLVDGESGLGGLGPKIEACMEQITYGEVAEETAKANARLIAAAPDLLAALQLLHDNLAEYQRINNLGGYDNHDMKMARAALAKALSTIAKNSG